MCSRGKQPRHRGTGGRVLSTGGVLTLMLHTAQKSPADLTPRPVLAQLPGVLHVMSPGLPGCGSSYLFTAPAWECLSVLEGTAQPHLPVVKPCPTHCCLCLCWDPSFPPVCPHPAHSTLKSGAAFSTCKLSAETGSLPPCAQKPAEKLQAGDRCVSLTGTCLVGAVLGVWKGKLRGL